MLLFLSSKNGVSSRLDHLMSVSCGFSELDWQLGQKLIDIPRSTKRMLIPTFWPGKKDAAQGRERPISRRVAFSWSMYFLFWTFLCPCMLRNRKSRTESNASQELTNCMWTGATHPMASSNIKGSWYKDRSSWLGRPDCMPMTALY
jgi:hypothetical protein